MTTTERIIRWCHHCDAGIDLPNKGLGRAHAATWATQHQGHLIGDSPTHIPDGATWKTTCETCGHTEQGIDVNDLDQRFTLHAITHTTGTFDQMPKALMEPVTLTGGAP